MLIEDRIEEIKAYLPIKYETKTADYFKTYLLDTIQINWDGNKPQFSLLAVNVLFMTFIYKNFWFDDRILNKKVPLNDQLPKNIYELAINEFAMSKYNEKLVLGSYLKYLDFDDNEISDIKKLIDYRDHTAHACGKIYYNEQKVESYIDDYMNTVKEISSKQLSKITKRFLEEFGNMVNDPNSTITVAEFCMKKIGEYRLSLVECQNILTKINCQNNDINDVYYHILKYYLNKLIEDVFQTSYGEDEFKEFIKEFVITHPNELTECKRILEYDLNSPDCLWEKIEYCELNDVLFDMDDFSTLPTTSSYETNKKELLQIIENYSESDLKSALISIKYEGIKP